MPRRPLCTGCATEEKTTIMLYCVSKRHGKPTIYLQVDHLDWLFSYAADELHHQGVICEEPSGGAVKIANCTAVADVHLGYNFSAKKWEAEFVTGALTGVKRTFCITDLTTELVEKMKAVGMYQNEVTEHLGELSRQKQLAKRFITFWCDAISQDDHEIFEKEWGLQGNEGVTSTVAKRRRRASGGHGSGH